MKYISTRGLAPPLDFEEAVLAGLAGDGGLYVPEDLPVFTKQELREMAALPYAELAQRVMTPFIGKAVAPAALAEMLRDTYAQFAHPKIAPLAELKPGLYILELFHGPTLAFKDFALQFLGRLLSHILAKRKEDVVIVGATSGDTGSAAIAGCRGRAHMQIFILHPKGRVSEVQRRQMTSVLDGNVHNIALEGTFDDCQDIVKALFADEAFRAAHKLVAINSINWARILAQLVYYFYAAFALGAPEKAVSFSVPTGNFGDIYAGYIAKRMGLPVDQLIIATNKNDILARCLSSGIYGIRGVSPSLSPSMDIQISSNFERLLFDLHDRDGKQIAELMATFRKEKRITLELARLNALRLDFSGHSVSDEETLQTIADIYASHAMLIDPHTAVGVKAAQSVRRHEEVPMVVLATAHPAKFPEAVEKATGAKPPLPAHLSDLMQRGERCDSLANDVADVQSYIRRHVA